MTEKKFLEEILNNGLIPLKGIRSTLIGETKTAIFYSKGFEGVIAMFFMMIEKYIEYRGSEGDIHIDSYNVIKKMIEDRKTCGKDVGNYLIEMLTKELEIIESINFARNCSSYKEFLGDRVCLKLNNISEEKMDSPALAFYNFLTTSTIFPKDISIVVLKHQQTGEILDSKYDISKVSLDEMKKILYDDDEKQNKMGTHLLWKIMLNYYTENKEYLEENFKKYDIIEIPISKWLNKKGIAK